MLAITLSASKSYTYALPQCLRAIASAAAHYDGDVHFILSTDKSPEGGTASELAKSLLPAGWEIHKLEVPLGDDPKDYKPEAQLRIAALQGAGFAYAKAKIRPDLCWVVESDNIVAPDALRLLEWTLRMPTADGSPFYDVAAATYPNGLFLGGFGSYQNPIAEDFLAGERKLPARLKRCLESCEARLKAGPVEKELRRLSRLHGRVRKCPPDGNVWEVTAKHGWRRRGWMDYAYPGIGRGAVVPSDWCGLGCTLLSRRALALADFAGYNGAGTQDLFLCWQKWHPAGLRIACVPHALADHVKRENGKLIHYRAYHEPEGEFRGHLRVRRQEFVAV